MNVYFYLLCFRTEALVASNLPAEEFGAYMAIGTRKRTHGHVVFFEVDPTLCPSHFDFEAARQRCQPSADGMPKRSKYVSVYRVLEHVPCAALGKLYLVTPDGRVLGLDAKPYDTSAEESGYHMYVELCPVTPRVVSSLAPAAFAASVTNPESAIYVPRIFFADQLLDRDLDGSLAGYLPYPDPQHIIDCIEELRSEGNKEAKTVDRNPSLNAFYRTIRKGFFVGDRTGLKFYALPSKSDLEEKHHHWWRSASMA